jgi:hypothetical protein
VIIESAADSLLQVSVAIIFQSSVCSADQRSELDSKRLPEFSATGVLPNMLMVTAAQVGDGYIFAFYQTQTPAAPDCIPQLGDGAR